MPSVDIQFDCLTNFGIDQFLDSIEVYPILWVLEWGFQLVLINFAQI